MGKRRVILYGRSMILATVSASLAQRPDLEVLALSPPLPGSEELLALAPGAILFDLDAGRPEAAFALLKNHPNLLLIGINPENEELLLWSGRQGRVFSAEDIVQAIAQIPGPAGDQPAAGGN